MQISKQGLHSYMFKKIIINFWLVNAVINGVMFFLITSDKGKMFGTEEIAFDYLMSIVILGMAAALTGFPIIKKDIDKGIAPKGTYEREEHIIVKYFSNNKIINSVIITIMTIILIVPFFVGIPAMFGMSKLNFIQSLILKTIATGFAGVIVGYFVIVLSFTESRKTSKA
ncbi:hypothetical protein [Clostridium gasigenes]|uniref:hypothetical protein n=1 Tax=Clostridium gasigenes TaxID=94869 RepID=UPI001C0DAB26|nr:hypothetical protein [Clostridium gasigenes]MBU3103558.1 hypothetical protein [Clostridium gasigenes]